MIKTHTYPIVRRAGVIVAIAALAFSVTTTWLAPEARAAPPSRGHAAAAAAAPAPIDDDEPIRMKKPVPRGKLNLNTASEEQLQMLPGVGPAKAERIVAWRKKNGGFRRVADLRKVKGFGYKTLRKLEPWLAVTGETNIAPS